MGETSSLTEFIIQQNTDVEGLYPVSDGVRRFQCVDSNLISVLCKNNSICVIDLESGNVSHLEISCSSFCWGENSADNGDSEVPWFVTLDTEGNVSLFQFKKEEEETFCRRCQFNIKDVESVQSDPGCSIRLLSAQGDKLTILINDKIILIVQWMDTGQLNIIRKICHGQNLQDQDIRIKSNLLSVVQDNMLYIYILHEGHHIASVDMNVYNTESVDDLMTFDLSSDLQGLYVLKQSGNLMFIDLNSHFRRYPDQLIAKPYRTSKGKQNIDSGKEIKRNVTPAYAHWVNHLQGLDKKLKNPLADQSWLKDLDFSSGNYLSSRSCQRDKKFTSGLALGPPSSKTPSWPGSVASRNTSSSRSGSRLSGRMRFDCYWERQNCVHIPEIGKEYEVREMNATVDTCSIWAVSSGDGMQALFVVNMVTAKVQVHRIPGNCLPVLSTKLEFPHLIIRNTHISAILFNTNQQDFVNKLMQYDNASLANAVCKHNNWDPCSIPVHALEVGLRQRQLDTVAFFLKSRENMFLSAAMQHFQDSVTQVEAAMDLLVATIKTNMSEHQSKQFAEQLLHLTLDYLHRIVGDLVKSTKKANESEMLPQSAGESERTQHEGVQDRAVMSESELQRILDKMIKHIMDLRCYMKDFPKFRTGTQKQVAPDEAYGVLQHQKELLKKWKRMNLKECIEDGILCLEIPVLQVHLKSRMGSESASLAAILEIGLQRAVDYLIDREMKIACRLFSNMGFDSTQKLHQICMYTSDKYLRDYLAAELRASSLLSEEEEAMIHFVHQMETLYSCQSFEAAKTFRQEEPNKHWEDTYKLTGTPPTGESLVLSGCGEISNIEVTNAETHNYANVILEWVRSWDDITRQRILADILLHRKDPNIKSMVSPTACWEYLCCHVDLTRLQQWVDVMVSNGESEHAQTWPYMYPVTTEMIDKLLDTPPFIRETLLDQLARHGIFCSSESEDFEKKITRLARIHKVFPDAGNIDQYDHYNFVRYCIKHDLPQILWFYLDHCKIDIENQSDLEVMTADSPSMDMALKFRKLSKFPNDPVNIFEASLATGCMLHGSESSVTIGQWFNEGLVTRALATLMFLPNSYSTIAAGGTIDHPGVGSLPDLDKILADYPSIHSALFPSKHLPAAKRSGFNLYTLLQGNVQFDISRLFGWQPTNHLATEESMKELPHFSHPGLVSKYGHCKQLDYTYYLLHGRPSFAYTSYIASLIEMGVTTISKRRFSSIRHKATLLGVQNYYKSAIATSCVVFIEILGQDSIKLRLHVEVGQLILENCQESNSASGADRSEVEKNIAKLLVSCVRHRKDYALKTLNMLEAAIVTSLEKKQIKSTSYKAADQWTVAVMFCVHHQMALTDVYLKTCAEEDDWLMFLTFAQIHQYPREQLMELVLHFKSAHLQEHLHYVICNASSSETVVQRVVRKRSSSYGIRSQLYSRIGVKAALREQESSSSDSEEETQATASVSESAPSVKRQESLVRKDLVSQDVFGVLLNCLSASSPWRALLAHSVTFRNPILAVLASCCEECDMLSCLCVWLLTSTNDSLCQEGFAYIPDPEKHTWTMSDLYSVMHMLLSKHWSRTLTQGFRIFHKNSALIEFFEFCTSLNETKDWEACRDHIEAFKVAVKKLQRKSSDNLSEDSPPKSSGGIPCLDDRLWLEETVSSFLEVLMVTSQSSFITKNLLQLLDNANLSRCFQCAVPDFGKINRLYQIVYSTGLTMDAVEIFDPKSTNYIDHCDQLITELQARGRHNEARVFAETAQLSYPMITIIQAEQELAEVIKTSVWKCESARIQFWQQIHQLFLRHQTQPLLAVTFLKKQLDQSGSLADKCYLCELIYHWLSLDSSCDHQEEMSKVYMNMWHCKIQMHINKKVSKGASQKDFFTLTDADFTKLSIWKNEDPNTELTRCSRMPQQVPANPVKSLTKEETTALNELIGELLSQCQISEASRLASEFCHYSQDIAIVVTCLRLAQDVISPSEIDSRMKKLIALPRKMRRTSSVGHRFPRATSSASLMSLTAFTMETGDEKGEQVISTMEALSLHSQYDEKCCQRILTAYRVAQVLHVAYQNVVQEPIFETLKKLLLAGAFNLGREFIQASGIQPEEMAGFLADTVLRSLKVYTGVTPEETGAPGTEESKELVFSPQDGSTWLIQLTTLCQDPGHLGSRLLDAVTSLLTTNSAPSPALLWLEVEALICGHDCQTLACNMEGIVQTLRLARSCTVALHGNNQYNLMIRLLTGFGRYGEMTYIFDILKQQHQFELLFRKGIDKDKNFKLAILDYLKHFHPTDSETLTMVSLHFTMYREIAQLLEEAARKQLAKLKKPLTNKSETSSALQNIVQYYSDAAESYLKDHCVHHAEACMKQARLMALQQHLLPSGAQIIHQKSEDIRRFIVQHNRFYEAYIVSEAYRLTADWAQALCHNVLHRGDFKYLTSFQSHVSLTPQIFTDITSRFKQETNKSTNMIGNMKKLLSHCQDVSTLYRLAADLGFTDITVDLMRGESGAFVKDTFSRT